MHFPATITLSVSNMPTYLKFLHQLVC